MYLQLVGTSEEEIDSMRANIAFARECRMNEYAKLSKRSRIQRKVDNLKKPQPIKVGGSTGFALFGSASQVLASLSICPLFCLSFFQHPGKKYVCYAHRAHDIEHSTKGRMRKRRNEAMPIRLPAIEKKEMAPLQRMPTRFKFIACNPPSNTRALPAGVNHCRIVC
jgi:hypothetical protein